MAALWITVGLSLLAALAALAHSRRTARQLAELTQMYWALKFDHGELKAKVDPAEPPPPQPKETFVPLSRLRPPSPGGTGPARDQ